MTNKQDSKIKSADDLIVQDEAAKLGKPIPASAESTPKLESQDTPKLESQEKPVDKKEQPHNDLEPEQNEDIKGKEEKEPEQEELQQTENDDPSDDAPGNEEVDEYGTKVGKKKLYTEEEVNRMMRERFKRGRHSQEQQEDIQQAAKDFQHDPNSEESWEKQLETFIDQTIEKRETKLRDREWRQREEQNQAEFEVKFTNGMGKYSDFAQVVGNKPITNAMMLATRSMKDPAAFVYAACKQQPKELERIAQIQDPVAQATEIGRLEERMKKARKIPSSPKPASKITGDASDEMPQLDIDARIAQHAKSKIMR